MKCDRCGGPVESKTVSICAVEAKPPTIVRDVPAEVCSHCGEQTLTDETVGVFERIRDDKVSSDGEVSVTVYSYELALAETRLAELRPPIPMLTGADFFTYSIETNPTPVGEHVIIGPGTASVSLTLEGAHLAL